jgi:hypothetical protein
VQNQFPPIPCDPFPELPLYTDGTGNYYYDDRGFDYSAYRAGRMTADETPPVPSPGDGGSGSETYSGSFYFPTYTITTNCDEYTNFWLTITNIGSGQGQVSILSTLPGRVYAILTNSDLTTTNWGVWQILLATNSVTPSPPIGLSLTALYFKGIIWSNFWVSTNISPQLMVEALMGTNPVIVTNITYTGGNMARGLFGNGSMVLLNTNAPAFIDSGLILSTGWITNAYGPNNNDGGNGWPLEDPDETVSPSDLFPFIGEYSDSDLNNLVEGSGINDSAVLEFDIIATNSFQLTFEYVFASEEYPEWIGPFNDPFAIFISTNFNGTNWVNSITNDIALVPGTDLTIGVNNINGGCSNSANYPGGIVLASNPLYYIDNHDPNPDDSTLSPYFAAAPVYDLQYDGFTVQLTAQTNIVAGTTNHIKIAIGDCNDYLYDSTVFIKAGIPAALSCE